MPQGPVIGANGKKGGGAGKRSNATALAARRISLGFETTVLTSARLRG